MTTAPIHVAGGGLAGIAWQTGVLRGVAEQSPAAARLLLDSDLLVGTSAGSAVAAQISSGRLLEDLFDLCHRRFSIKTVVMVAKQVVSILDVSPHPRLHPAAVTSTNNPRKEPHLPRYQT